VRTELIPGLQSSVALWQLHLDSELVFVGDAGETEASGASKRSGIEINNHYAATPWLLLDADLAFSKTRFKQVQGDAPTEGRFVPGSVRTVVSMGATVSDKGPWFGQFQLRYFGPRPLVEDNSIRSKATTLAYARVGYKVSPGVKVSLDVFNLFNRKASDIDYYYESGSKDANGHVSKAFDVHSHPAEPRSLRLTVSANF
jgi:outer membrane receptor protein involved in Fe transport